ncbi:cell division protein FtsW [Lachnospiraceae bacterium NK3A20]|jgi:cell division protein FtsW|nr:cell division protein FtsW [Lachnospiraceae bacterium NK3A20]
MADSRTHVRARNGRTRTNTNLHVVKSGTPAKRGGRNTAKTEGEGLHDYSLLFIIFFLVVFGLIMLYSTSSYEAGIAYGDPAYYLKRQLLNSVIGILAMFFVATIDYHIFEKFSNALYVISVLMILAIIPFGREVNGAKRWLYLGPVSIQPAEISKIAIIVLTAHLLLTINKKELYTLKGTAKVMLPAIIQSAIIYGITRNLSSAIIVFGIAFCMLFVARRDFFRFIAFFGAVLAVAAGLVFYISSRAGDPDMDFRSGRVLAWLDPTKYANGKGFQTLQALYGIGSGGIIGKGLGQSMQKLGYIPEAQNDMIFSIICEELGMFGAISIIAMFIILCWRIMIIAMNAEDMFGGLVASGVMMHIAIQVVLNIAVVTNTIPNTGVTLPFISYGGSSVVIMLAEIGIVINIARSIRLRDLS